MSEFTHDWTSMHFPRWREALKGLVGRDHAHVLELGAYEGRATVWLLENVFTAPTTRYVAVDTFRGGSDHDGMGIDFKAVRERFLKNTEPHKFKVQLLEMPTWEAGRKLESDYFDFVYVDASHTAADTLADCVLAHRVMRIGGRCICDDYEWPGRPGDGPKQGIDAFLAGFRQRIRVTHVGYQVDWEKL